MLLGVSLVVAFVVVAVFAPLIAPHSPTATDFSAPLAHSSWRHPLGTDQLGRDELSRLVFGARVALAVALASTALALLVAVPLGLVSGYYGGLVDATVARATDVVLAFPFLLLAIGLSVITGPSLGSAIFVLAFAGAPGLVRIVRGETLSLREGEFVAAAVAAGARDGRILFRHVLPNVANTLLVQAPLFAARVIVAEAALAFLGLSVRPPRASWGAMLSDARAYTYQAPRLAVYPGIAIALATVAFIVLGDALRDALDPQSRR
jgi:ABC-type dipeptide/oligopeptide/nickel transport system permease subunit